METYEYELEPASRSASPSTVEDRLNARGAAGWELVTFEYGHMIFKRAK